MKLIAKIKQNKSKLYLKNTHSDFRRCPNDLYLELSLRYCIGVFAI